MRKLAVPDLSLIDENTPLRLDHETLGAAIKRFLHEGWRHATLINVSALVRAVEKQRALVEERK
jgi:hypothetical protein